MLLGIKKGVPQESLEGRERRGKGGRGGGWVLINTSICLRLSRWSWPTANADRNKSLAMLAFMVSTKALGQRLLLAVKKCQEGLCFSQVGLLRPFAQHPGHLARVRHALAIVCSATTNVFLLLLLVLLPPPLAAPPSPLSSCWQFHSQYSHNSLHTCGQLEISSPPQAGLCSTSGASRTSSWALR